MTAPKTLHIAYPDNQLVQRYVGSRQVQGKELELTRSDGVTVTGFVTGLDDDVVQLCATPNLDAILLGIPHIIAYGETGRTIDDLPADQIEEAKRFTKIFRRVAENELSRGPEDD